MSAIIREEGIKISEESHNSYLEVDDAQRKQI